MRTLTFSHFSLAKSLVCGLLAFCLGILPAHAEVNVTANVSSMTTTTDDPVRLTIIVSGARNANVPSSIAAEGLTIDYQGKSQSFEFNSGLGASISTRITYIVTPQRAGKFSIPAIDVEAGGQSFSTAPIAITVEKSNNAATSSDPNSSRQAEVYAELLLPKDSAYVGEIIPIEVRFYFQNNVTFQINPPGQVPQIDGEGFSKLRYPNPRIEQQNVRGKSYRVMIYQTSLVAAKSGELNVGPASLNFVVALPQRQRRSLFDDPFADQIFNNNPFFNQRIQREMTLSTETAKIQIKSLPTPRPEGFAGAVGQFTLATSARPTALKTGDPITYAAALEGRGNFDLVSAPALVSTDGWRTYPATGKFASTDEMGVSGTKTFEMAIIPEKKSDALPGLQFVYFDPAQEKFITLTSDPVPVQIEGPPALPPPLASATPSVPSAGKITPPPTIEPPVPELPPFKTALPGQPRSFEPVWKNNFFWAAQALPLLLLGALVWPRIAARFAPDPVQTRRLGLNKENGALADKLRSFDPAVFFSAAARQLEIATALAHPDLHAPSTSAEVLAQLTLREEDLPGIEEILRRRDELTYGGGRGGRELTPETHRRYTDLLRQYRP